MKRQFTQAGLLALALVAFDAAHAASFSDDFNDGVIDPAWWTVGTDGTTTVAAVNGRIEMTQGTTGFGALTLVPAVSGDFIATVEYALLAWPAANLERVALNAYFSPTQQLLIERVSDPAVDPLQVGEVYLTDFTGQGILGTPTSDQSGVLRLERTGDVVRGAYWNGTDWSVIGTFNQAGEGARDRLLGFGIFPGATATAGVKVAFDNFAVTPVSLPGALPLMLAAVAALGGRLRARR